MKKIIFLILIFFTTVLNVQSEEIKRITVGNEDAKITIIAVSYTHLRAHET